MMKVPEIIYEDNDILVVYKPAGIAVQTRRLGQQDMETLLKNYRAGKKETPYIGTVHRLDQPVEGVMVFGKNPKTTAALSVQIKERETGKYYFAIGRQKKAGSSEFPGIPENGTLTDYVGFDARKNLGYMLSPGDKDAKKAVLDYKILGMQTENREICFGIRLHTGRHHQIRLQMANLGYPLAGDTKYSDPGPEDSGNGTRPVRETLALCSCRICFRHPQSKKEVAFFHMPENSLFKGYSLPEFR